MAKKFDQGKLRVDLLPPDALEALADIYTHGAKEYGDRNWEDGGFSWGRLFAAMMRHAWAFWRGEDMDPESGLPHAAHMTWNAMALLAYWLRGQGKDDRSPVVGYLQHKEGWNDEQEVFKGQSTPE